MKGTSLVLRACCLSSCDRLILRRSCVLILVLKGEREEGYEVKDLFVVCCLLTEHTTMGHVADRWWKRCDATAMIGHCFFCHCVIDTKRSLWIFVLLDDYCASQGACKMYLQ